MTDAEVAKFYTYCTTTKARHVRVLYNDGKTALVKHPGGKDGRVFREWIPAWVDLVPLDAPRKDLYRTVWECDSQKNPPLTRNRLVELVLSLGLDPTKIRNAF